MSFQACEPETGYAWRREARPKVSPLPKWRLKRVEDHVRAHISDPVRLTELATVAGLSRMHFAAQFRAATGYTPHTYLLNRRIEEAKTLMSTTSLSLAEVALAVGFQAQCHFSTVFKRFTGETPATWRNARRHPASAQEQCAA